MKAWHFVGDKLRDGRPVPKDGKWLEHKGQVVMCESGFHFSVHPFDALQHAPGPILCRVEVEDVVDRHTDKGVCRRRMIEERRDVTRMLELYSRLCALDVISLWDAPEVMVRFLKTGDEKLRETAWAAAWFAARAAPAATPEAAAAVAARGVPAAWAAARAADWAAAAGWDDVRLKQRRRFKRMVMKEFKG